MTCDLVASVKSATQIVLSQTKKNYDMDEMDLERIKEDLAKMTSVTSQVMELTGQLVEIFKDQAEPTVRAGAQAYFAGILQSYSNFTEDEVIDSLCFFCDFIEHTSACKDTATVAQLASKYVEIGNSKLGENENVAHTVAYGLGEFGYLLPKATFQPMLAKAVQFVKKAISAPDAFDDDRLITTENSMGALAKLCYAHMDGSVLAPADLVAVLNRMPFTSDENESMTTHRLLLDQIENPASVIHNAAIKPAA